MKYSPKGADPSDASADGPGSRTIASTRDNASGWPELLLGDVLGLGVALALTLVSLVPRQYVSNALARISIAIRVTCVAHCLIFLRIGEQTREFTIDNVFVSSHEL